jgi:hypothetical protein
MIATVALSNEAVFSMRSDGLPKALGEANTEASWKSSGDAQRHRAKLGDPIAKPASPAAGREGD